MAGQTTGEGCRSAPGRAISSHPPNLSGKSTARPPGGPPSCDKCTWRFPRCPLLHVTPAPTPRTPAGSQHKGGRSPQGAGADRRLIRLQVWAGVSSAARPQACHPGPGHTPLSSTLVLLVLPPWSRPRASGPPGPREMLLTAPALPVSPAYLGGQERPPRDLPAGSGSPQRLQPLGQGKGLLGPRPSAWDGALPAGLRHVAGHVTAWPAAWSWSQAEAEPAAGWAGLELSLAPSWQPGPERGSH